jgi:16S rRNA (cytidine1402-2'-O)-methyltransferase
MSGKLYLIPTPIGNLEDITLRAIRVLKEVDLILAEDTRVSLKLLNHYEIKTSLLSYHMHNEHYVVDKVIERLQEGTQIAIISDAGTPGISDPGFLLVRKCIENQIAFECLPGANAFVPAAIYSGLPLHEFTFIGFLPLKKGRKTKLEELAKEKRVLILYESPHKILRTITDLGLYFGLERKASLSREISKKFEETIRGTLEELKKVCEERLLKGEMVLVVDGLNDKIKTK